jgi:hypothetical protein
MGGFSKYLSESEILTPVCYAIVSSDGLYWNRSINDWGADLNINCLYESKRSAESGISSKVKYRVKEHHSEYIRQEIQDKWPSLKQVKIIEIELVPKT